MTFAYVSLLGVKSNTRAHSPSRQEYVAEEYDMDMEEIVLNFNGTPLSDEQTVEQFGLVSGSTLDATVKLFGGKVHGSLARAGKVKGQTPKVERSIDRDR